MFVGCLGYADDFTLLAPSVTGLQTMLNTCHSFGKAFSVVYNATKTECMKLSKDSKKCNAHVYLSNSELKWVESFKYLGTYITSNLCDVKDINIKRCGLFSNVNDIMCKFGRLSSQLLCNIFSQFCCSFYGSQTWYLGNRHLHFLYTAYNRSLRRVWKIPWRSHTNIVHGLSSKVSLEKQLAVRFLKMFECMYFSHNVMLTYLAKRSLGNGMCSLGGNINWLCNRFNLNIKNVDISVNIHLAMSLLKYNQIDINLSSTCNVIHELCDIADGLSVSVLSRSQARELACYISTY